MTSEETEIIKKIIENRTKLHKTIKSKLSELEELLKKLEEC